MERLICKFLQSAPLNIIVCVWLFEQLKFKFRPLACRDGRLRRNDQIIRINGCSLEGLPHNEAVQILQAAHGLVELVVLRDLHSDPRTAAATTATTGTGLAPPPPRSPKEGRRESVGAGHAPENLSPISGSTYSSHLSHSMVPSQHSRSDDATVCIIILSCCI